MKLSRLYQPRHPIFWLALALNALSMALGWLVQNRPLNTLGLLIVLVFGLGNAIVGMWLAWQLVRDPPPGSPPPAPPQGSAPALRARSTGVVSAHCNACAVPRTRSSSARKVSSMGVRRSGQCSWYRSM